VALEASSLGARLVDLDPADGLDRSVGALLAEIDDPGPEDQIALRRGQRYVARLQRAKGLGEAGSPFCVAGAHLITGGLGGLGSQLALRLAAAGAEHLVLIVKHPLPEPRSWEALPADDRDFTRVKIVRQLEAAGARVSVAALDLADESSLVEWFAAQDFATIPLRGVWHTAMSYSSAPVAELEPEAVSSMIKVKSNAAWRLHELSRGHQLDYFVLFSSTTALWGAVGLAHYAAANAFLDALAHFRRAERLPATVVNWGVWQQMRSLPKFEQARAARVGLRPMAGSAALAALERVLAAGVCQAIVADVDWAIFKPAYESQRYRPLLEGIVAESAANAPATQDDREGLLIGRLVSSAADDRRELLAQHVHQLLTEVLGIGTDAYVDRDKGFFELGMDSLTSVQMRSRLERNLRRRWPTTLMFNYPTIDLLTDYLVRELFPNASETLAGQSAAFRKEASAVAPGPTDDDDATEEELFDQLAARILPKRT
jgi:myxalamid-type polyketide synthase MxaE and MxaD